MAHIPITHLPTTVLGIIERMADLIGALNAREYGQALHEHAAELGMDVATLEEHFRAFKKVVFDTYDANIMRAGPVAVE